MRPTPLQVSGAVAGVARSYRGLPIALSTMRTWLSP